MHRHCKLLTILFTLIICACTKDEEKVGIIRGADGRVFISSGAKAFDKLKPSPGMPWPFTVLRVLAIAGTDGRACPAYVFDGMRVWTLNGVAHKGDEVTINGKSYVAASIQDKDSIWAWDGESRVAGISWFIGQALSQVGCR